MTGEYALLMAAPPLGLGMSEEEVGKVARMGMECRFRVKDSEAKAGDLRN